MDSSSSNDQVLVEENSFARTIILNRPRQLNALSYPMISRLLELFLAYEEDPNVKLVIVKGKGRAFCAGGDVAAVVHDISKGHWKFGANFFWDEFRLNYLLATYSKPQVSILNGIAMGGGAGASIHGRFRIATENSVFAMPETALGLFPDVGASYFLSRLPGFVGEYAGLTGARLDGAEMLACGLATHFVPASEVGSQGAIIIQYLTSDVANCGTGTTTTELLSYDLAINLTTIKDLHNDKLSFLEEELLKLNSSDQNVVSSVIDNFSLKPSLKEKSAFHRLDIIDKCFSRRTVEEILCALEREGMDKADNWISTAIDSLKKASPTSLKISLRSIREGRLQGVGQCLIREYRMCCHVLRSEASKDFFEGCRAILLDKDKNPKVKSCSFPIVLLWEPSSLELISDDLVDKYFSKVDDREWEELKLPVRRSLSASAMAKL
ncbi:hypothetical protein Sjap_004370 [Stephania japonica]|uniref:3-hydroxyisobutyryl-CoA hydrolase n=1 Tax=Stephania japonica TaxID=461633 RepID=A0AAP0K4A7_9MAGN